MAKITVVNTQVTPMETAYLAATIGDILGITESISRESCERIIKEVIEIMEVENIKNARTL